jgi:Ca2+-binding RTX toxin-like protein
MHYFRTIRRLALGAVLFGAAIAGVPAVASAASTCTYDPTSGGVVTINDGSSTVPLKISVVGSFITIDDGGGNSILCRGGGAFALTSNTGFIKVNSSLSSSLDGYVIDQSEGLLGPGSKAETDGNSEIEVTVVNTGVKGSLRVIGSTGNDTMKVGGAFGQVGLGNDSDLDILVSTGSNVVQLDGGPGTDFLTGNGNAPSLPGRTNVRLRLNGDADADALFGGSTPDDILQGGGGDDFINSNDGTKSDTLLGGSGSDTAVADSSEAQFNSIENVTFVNSVGKLRLTPRVLRAEAGMIARLKLSWTHPKAWRELRRLNVALYDGKRAVGTVRLRPGGERVTGSGSVALARGSELRHRGKTVTAKLVLHVPKALAGDDLRVDVQATDAHGHRRLDRGAGTIRVR